MRRVLSLFHSLIGKKVLMAVTGVVLLGFLAFHMYGNLKAFQGPEHLNAYAGYHLLDLTFGRVHPDFVPGNVYHNLIASFQRPFVAGLYIAAMLVLSLHLYHGILSGFQTLGLNHPRYNGLRRAVALGFTAVVIPGFMAVPAAVLLGVLR